MRTWTFGKRFLELSTLDTQLYFHSVEQLIACIYSQVGVFPWASSQCAKHSNFHSSSTPFITLTSSQVGPYVHSSCQEDLSSQVIHSPGDGKTFTFIHSAYLRLMCHSHECFIKGCMRYKAYMSSFGTDKNNIFRDSRMCSRLSAFPGRLEHYRRSHWHSRDPGLPPGYHRVQVR